MKNTAAAVNNGACRNACVRATRRNPSLCAGLIKKISVKLWNCERAGATRVPSTLARPTVSQSHRFCSAKTRQKTPSATTGSPPIVQLHK